MSSGESIPSGKRRKDITGQVFGYLTCKLCNTKLKKKDFRRDGSVLCPVCGQIYWKEAVEKALQQSDEEKRANENRK